MNYGTYVLRMTVLHTGSQEQEIHNTYVSCFIALSVILNIFQYMKFDVNVSGSLSLSACDAGWLYRRQSNCWK